MLRAFLVVGLILLLLIAAVFGPRLIQPRDSEAGTAPIEECDLDAEACSWSGTDDEWRVSLRGSSDASQNREYEVEVTTTEEVGGLLVVLRGASMYMGEYPVPLQQQDDGVYLARFTAPLCTTGSDMRWRLDLQEGQSPVGAAPFHMLFQGHAL